MAAVTTGTRASTPIWRRSWFRTGLIWAALIALTLIGTRFYTPGTEPSSVAKATDPTQFAQENYQSKVVPAITSKALNLGELVKAQTADADGTCEKSGHRNGESPCSYPVKFTGTITEGEFGEVGVKVKDVPSSTKVGIQTGPAINGTAVRDASGFITFSMFENQIDFAKVASELNNQIKTEVLAKNKLTEMIGQEVDVVGALTYDNPSHLLVTPISIEKTNG